jgi:RNA polymerase sigma factor (sigma-70 family)
MGKATYSDAEIVRKIKKGGQSFEEVSMYLFDSFKGFISKVNSQLHLDDVAIKDAYADALVKCIGKVKDDTYRGESKLSSYFYRIFYNKAIDISRQNLSARNLSLDEIDQSDAKERDLIELFDIKEVSKSIEELIAFLGSPCKKILIDWAYYGYSMDEIAQRCKLKNADSARSMKYKCLKKLRKSIAIKLGKDV